MSCMVVNNKTISALISVLIDSFVISENQIEEVAHSIRELNLQSVYGRKEVSSEEWAQAGKFEFKYHEWLFTNPYHMLQIAWLVSFLFYQCNNAEFFDNNPMIKFFETVKLQTTRQYQRFLTDIGYDCRKKSWFDVELFDLPDLSPEKMQWGF